MADRLIGKSSEAGNISVHPDLLEMRIKTGDYFEKQCFRFVVYTMLEVASREITLLVDADEQGNRLDGRRKRTVFCAL